MIDGIKAGDVVRFRREAWQHIPTEGVVIDTSCPREECDVNIGCEVVRIHELQIMTRPVSSGPVDADPLYPDGSAFSPPSEPSTSAE